MKPQRPNTCVNVYELDVSALPAPEPMHEILKALGHLPKGCELRVWHRKAPIPLYPILEQQGYDFQVNVNEQGVQIRIWRDEEHRDVE